MAGVHANGDVVCGIIDGRGEYVLGNVHREPLSAIFAGARYRELRELVLSTPDGFCRAIGKRCPLKTVAEPPPRAELRYLAIEPTTACRLRCLACPVRDIAGGSGWRAALGDGGWSFLAWDGLRRAKQELADALGALAPRLRTRLRRRLPALLRGRMPGGRAGTLPLEVLKRVLEEAGPSVRRVDLFGYGEPFLYPQLTAALRHAREVLPGAELVVATGGTEEDSVTRERIVDERLADWLVFSIDGCDAASYGRYRIGGDFERAFDNLVRTHRRAAGSGVRVIWQYVVFRWNDGDRQLRRAVAMAEQEGITLWFDFAGTWGRSRRKAAALEHVRPHLKPCTALPGEPRQDGW